VRKIKLLTFLLFSLVSINNYVLANANSFSNTATPKFSGFFVDGSIGTGMISQDLNSSGSATPYSNTYTIQDSTSKNPLVFATMLKLGYSWEWQQQYHLSIAAFYNFSGLHTITQESYYNNNLGYLYASSNIHASYGFLIEPGYNLDSASLFYLNLGLGFAPISTTTSFNDTGSAEPVYNTETTTNKTVSSPIVGFGYQRQVNFFNDLHTTNLNWYLEYNYWFGNKVSASNSTTVPIAGSTFQATAEGKASYSQLMLGLRYYFA
jgi:hypothetical protein